MNATRAEAVKTLTRARKLLRRGFIQGSFSDRLSVGQDGHLLSYPVAAYCSVGAIERADGPGERAAMEALSTAILERHADLYEKPDTWDARAVIIRFNDTYSSKVAGETSPAYYERPGQKTKRLVLSMFDAAIERLQGEAGS